jgi:hypothetical protein
MSQCNCDGTICHHITGQCFCPPDYIVFNCEQKSTTISYSLSVTTSIFTSGTETQKHKSTANNTTTDSDDFGSAEFSQGDSLIYIAIIGILVLILIVMVFFVVKRRPNERFEGNLFNN